MDKKVIEKVIKHYGEPCPGFKYENPLLDKNVATLLSKSFLKLLNDPIQSGQNRALVLRNIRKTCKVEPPEHLYIDDNVTELLKSAYEEHLNDNNINKVLDSFLIRNLKEMNINSIHVTQFKPEIIKAITNLNEKKIETHDVFLKDLIYWNIDSNQNCYLDILKSMWNLDNITKLKPEHDDISLKIKPFIEEQLLTCAYEILSTMIIDDDWFTEKEEIIRLVGMCSVSSDCFQICCSILNSLFINTNFDEQLRRFITLFIDSIKLNVGCLSQLYPSNLQHLVLLLDIKLEKLDAQIKETYIEVTLKHLYDLQEECEHYVVMLLSHFYHNWFNHYYHKKIKNIED